nr:hypothetical protein L203_01722 [Cryptococcus depauperatus CBS 7841]
MPARSKQASQATQRKGKGKETAAAQVESDHEGYGDDVATGNSGSLAEKVDIEAKAGVLVRLALFQEYKRMPIRRTEVIKQVLPNNSRSWNVVFDRAQAILRDTFGCELCETRPRGKGEVQEIHTQTQNPGNQRRPLADGGLAAIEEGAEEAGTRVYVLQSILPSETIKIMAEPFAFDHDVQDEVEDEDSGALIRWDKGDGGVTGHVGLLGIRTVILSIIMCLGRVVSDDHLHALLRRFNLHRDTVLPYVSKDVTEPPLTLDRYLDLLARQSYLEKIKEPGPNGQAEGGLIEWRWGYRESEFSYKAAGKFIEEIMLGREGDSDSDDDNEDVQPGRRERDRQREERVSKRQKLQNDLAKAAGGPLTGRDYHYAQPPHHGKSAYDERPAPSAVSQQFLVQPVLQVTEECNPPLTAGPMISPHQDLDTFLEAFWTRQMDTVEGEEPDWKSYNLPLARIKKVMKSDEIVRMISAEAPIIFSKACEIFISELTCRAWLIAESHKRRTLQKSDVAAAIAYSDMFDFLIDIVPRDGGAGTGGNGQTGNGSAAHEEDGEGDGNGAVYPRQEEGDLYSEYVQGD